MRKVFFLFLALFLMGNLSFAMGEPWEVDHKKVFTITFNMPIDPDSVNDDTIFLLYNDEKIRTDKEIEGDIVRVYPSEEGYFTGDYILIIRDVYTPDGKTLMKEETRNFQVPMGIDKIRLIDLIKEIEEINFYRYTTSSVRQLENILREAKELLENKEATHEEIEEVFTLLKEKRSNLRRIYIPSPKENPTPITINKTELKKIIDEANMIELESYTEATKTHFHQALVKAQVIYDKNNSTQAEVDTVAKELKEAMNGLELMPDKTALKELIAEVVGINIEIHTEDTRASINTALTKAIEIYDNINSTKSEVDRAILELRSLKEGLKLIVKIEDIEYEDYIGLDLGTTEAEMKEKLPKTIRVKLNTKAQAEDINVLWNTESYYSNEPNLYEFKGSYEIDGLSEEVKWEVSIKVRLNGEPFVEEDFLYDATTSNVMITGLSDLGIEKLKKTKKLNMPMAHNGKSVFTIAKGAFKNLDIEEVSFPEFLTKIEESAFESNNITKLKLPEVLKIIENYAFKCSEDKPKIRTVKTFGKIKEIGEGAFMNSDIEEMTIPSSIEKLSTTAFKDSKGHPNTGKVHVFTHTLYGSLKLKDSDYHIINPACVKYKFNYGSEVIEETAPMYLCKYKDWTAKEYDGSANLFKNKEYYRIHNEYVVEPKFENDIYELKNPSLFFKIQDKTHSQIVPLIKKDEKAIIVDFKKFDDIIVPLGTDLFGVRDYMPKEVIVIDSKGKEHKAKIRNWDSNNYKENTPGTYQVEVYFNLPEGVYGNPDKFANLFFVFNVTVEGQD